MPLRPETESLQTLENQKRSERFHTRSHVSEDLHLQFHSKRQRPELLAESDTMETWRGFGKRGELAPREVKFPCKGVKSSLWHAVVARLTRRDGHSSDGVTVTTYPLCSAVD